MAVAHWVVKVSEVLPAEATCQILVKQLGKCRFMESAGKLLSKVPEEVARGEEPFSRTHPSGGGTTGCPMHSWILYTTEASRGKHTGTKPLFSAVFF